MLILFLFRHYIYLKLTEKGLIKRKYKPIIGVEKNGFTIHYIKKDSKKYFWSQIKRFELISNTKISIQNINNKVITLSENDYNNWHFLLKVLPIEFRNDRIEQLTNEYFKDLKTCKICGKIAVKNSSCLHCFNSYETTDFENSLIILSTDQIDKNNYIKSRIKQEQLFWFSYNEMDKKVDFYYDCFVFETDRNWKPLVTEREVIEYNKTR